jgi:hypothetical protein
MCVLQLPPPPHACHPIPPLSSPLLLLPQVSPEAADAAETICSLTFASRVRGVELNPTRRKPDAAGAVSSAVTATKTALVNSAASSTCDGKPMSALRAAALDTCKGPICAVKNSSAATPARATPRRLEKDAAQVRRSLDKENSGVE